MIDKKLNLPQGAETILFVDDEEMLRAVVVDFLVALGYNVLSTSSGEEAISLASNYPGKIDLLLTDVLMPEMNGAELVEKLAPTRSDMKVMYVSGYPPPILEPYGILKQGVILLQKPFTIGMLSVKIREVLAGKTA